MLLCCETAGHRAHLHRGRLMLAGTSQRPGPQSPAQRCSMVLLYKHPRGKLLITKTRNGKILTMKFYMSTKHASSSFCFFFVFSVQLSRVSAVSEMSYLYAHFKMELICIFRAPAWFRASYYDAILKYFNIIFKQSGILKFSPWLTVNWVAPGCKSA